MYRHHLAKMIVIQCGIIGPVTFGPIEPLDLLGHAEQPGQVVPMPTELLDLADVINYQLAAQTHPS
jgi:hypothetical protein